MKFLSYKMLMTLFALGMILWSCDSFIYDDLKDCPQGVYVKFYSMTPCESDSTFIGSVPSLTVFAFDKSDKLVTSINKQNVTLSRDFEVLMPVSDGNFSFVAWAGVDDKFTTATFTNGITTKKDVMLTLKSNASVATELGNTHVWQGESPVIFLPSPKDNGSFFQHTAVNLRELTNRLKVIVEFDKTINLQEVKPQDLTIAVSSANGMTNINGSMPLGSPVLNYPSINTAYTDRSVTWNFALMDLVTGYKNSLKIDYWAKDRTLFSGDLIGSILLLYEKDININLACMNDFTVKFVVRDYCSTCTGKDTYFSCDILVNDWLIHSYETDLGL